MIPTYYQCKEICQKNQVFYESKFEIDGFQISIFNYRYPQYHDFVNHSAFELRGLTFVFDGKEFISYPLFEKFFNINEIESTRYENVSQKTIKSVYIKEDGSIISFIKLPNGRILSKSKTTFESDQALLSQKLFEENSILNESVTMWLNQGITPIFELVSPKNKIVVDYPTTKLVLLGLRRLNGEYLNIDEIPLPKSEKVNMNLDQLISLRESLEGFEGWVVEFVDNQRIKIKTDWYLSLHRIFTESSHREDYLISMYLDEQIDDLISLHKIGTESRDFIESVIKKIKERIISLNRELNFLLSDYNGDKKVFSLRYSNHKYFGLSMRIIGGGNKDDIINEYIKKVTYRLEGARKWLWD